MSTQRMVKDSFWTDSYIANLDPVEKLLFLYLLTNPLCNIAGIYEIQIRRIAFDTGIEGVMVEKLLKRFEKDKKVLYVDGYIMMVNHAKHQMYKNPSVLEGIQRIIDSLPPACIQALPRLSHLTLLNLTLPTGETNVSQKLTTNSKKNMAWTPKHSDNDDDLDVIDMDSGEMVKQKEKKRRHYKEVYPLFKVLGPVPLNWTVNTTQQECAENLYTERGIEQIKSALQFFLENKDKEYIPEITSPYDLDSKWKKLLSFKKKNG